MTYNQVLAERVRNALVSYHTEEKQMFGSRCFMVNNKMCVTVGKDRLMCRLDATAYEAALKIEGVKPMVHGGRVMRGYVFVPDPLVESDEQLDRWLVPALAYNKVLTRKKRTT